MRPLEYEAVGSGPPLVLIHGWGVNHLVWKEQVAGFSADHRVIAVKLPGHGCDPLPEGEGPLTIATCADMLGALLEKERITGACLAGWSLGAEVAARAALAMGGDTVKSLVLIGGTPCYLAPSQTDTWAQPRPKALYFKRQLERDFRAALGYFMMTFFDAEHELTPERVAEVKALFFNDRFPPDTASAMQLLDSLYADDIREEVKGLKQPCLICHGDRDIIVPTDVTDLWGDLLQNSEALLLENCGHAPFLTHPQAFARAVKGFIERTV